VSEPRYDTPFVVRPEPDLADLVPTYLQRRHTDAETISAALEQGDLEVVRIVGHSMKGSGGGYGFDGLTDIGQELENAGRESDAEGATAALRHLRDYLANVEVVYE
jgi:HPt (histidine-containing phosphotransfer) domain-containing protein